MQYFPLFLDTSQCHILIVGAGEVANRKLDLLARTQAKIKVVAPQVDAGVLAFAESGRIEIDFRPVEEQDLQGVDLLYMATANKELNASLATLAKQQGILVNVVDSPELCRFITPSIVDRGRLVVAISTAGAAPVFARQLRARLEAWLPNSIKPLFDFIAERRSEVQEKVLEPKVRRLVWERFFDLNADRFDENTEQHYQTALAVGNHASGEILLLDDETPLEYLPMAAIPLLQKIDTIAFDKSPEPALFELVRRDASRSTLPTHSQLQAQFEQGMSTLICASPLVISQFKSAFPMAKQIKAGAL